MVRPAQGPLNRPPGTLRNDLLAIAAAGISGASAGLALSRALTRPSVRQLIASPSVHVVAAGKAAATMAAAALAESAVAIRSLLAVGTHRIDRLPPLVEWFEASHPLPDERSVAAGRRAAEVAAAVPEDGCLLLLLSGGASALLASPAEDLSLDDKRQTIETMMRAGADITELNTVRKHLSLLKGGRLAALSRGRTVTLAVSDVIGDDVSVIGSGPGVPDETTWDDARRALEQRGGDAHVPPVIRRIQAGLAGAIPDTPKPGDRRMERATGVVIASRLDALAGARDKAEALGYRTVVHEGPIAGEARDAAREWYEVAVRELRSESGPACLISAGETTVRVTGSGKGGRNQEFALALARTVSESGGRVAIASVGTDGIDGPTDAAGAIVDATTMMRAAQQQLRDPSSYLEQNNAYAFFDALGDLIRTGRTDTNVGDLQILVRD